MKRTARFTLPLSIIGIIGVLIIIYTYLYRTPAELQAVSSTILVFVTVWYAIKISQTLEEARKDRERDVIIQLISEGIDPILEVLNSHETASRKPDDIDDNHIHFPEYRWEKIYQDDNHTLSLRFENMGVSFPLDQAVRADLLDDYPEVIQQSEHYSSEYKEYSDLRNSLKKSISDHICDNFAEDNREWLDSLDDPRMRSNEEIIRQRSDLYADLVVRGTYERQPPVCENKTYFKNIRDSEPFSEQFRELENHKQNLERVRSQLKEKANGARESYKTEYDIKEMHLEDFNQE